MEVDFCSVVMQLCLKWHGRFQYAHYHNLAPLWHVLKLQLKCKTSLPHKTSTHARHTYIKKFLFILKFILVVFLGVRGHQLEIPRP